MKTKLILAGLFALLALPAAYAAGEPAPIAAIKAEASVESDVVRVGDLIDHAGPAAAVPAFRAPALGTTGTVQVHRVVEVARENGILLVDTRGLHEVTVTRAARTIALPEIELAVVEAARRELGVDSSTEISVRFDHNVPALRIEPAATDAPRLAQFSYDRRTRRFIGTVEVAGSAILRRQPVEVSGTLQEIVEVVMLARPIPRGETLRAGDLFIERRPRAELSADVLTRPEAAIGQAARRALRANQVLRPADLMKPDLVARNDLVTILFETPGMTLTARGKALASGAEGDVIGVVNPQSNRVLQAIVEAPGLVVVGRVPALAASAAGVPR